jgi:penicillin V acylase-like amidase (Ntn superfamily)
MLNSRLPIPTRLGALLAVVSLSFSLFAPAAIACTRAVYKGPNGTVMTGRSMDFSLPIPANLWLLPRGMERNGETGENTVSWTSRYGSIVATSWDIASSDGMNEVGLVGNMLWLVNSEYAEFSEESERPGLAISLWLQYALDNFGTVAEAVEALAQEEFVVVTDFIPGTDKFTTVHLSLSDPTGDSAIFEYIGGKLQIHHDPSYIVMTNDPVFEQQLAILRYWQEVSPKEFLPGTNRAADRFVRAHYYIQNVTQTDDPLIAVAAVFSVIRNVSVPYGISIEGFPNLSTTRWRVVADQTNLRYFFESVTTPNTFWLDFRNLDFSEGAPVKVLRADRNQTYAGEASGQMVESEPFRFQGI